ncbi:MAG: response regulator transcription factor [Lachnospiraceae bacterium]|nr:response regulator transcription factor [Lachnospiraceae bacterium]
MRLLLAEDEREMANAILVVLEHNHYAVDVVENGRDAYDWAKNGNYDGILLDIMMPEMSGLEVLSALRQENFDVPVLLLTARSEVDDRVAGLDLGADDYLTKPFAMKELLARIRAMTRRKGNYSSNLLQFGGLTLNRETFDLGYQGEKVHLGSKEYQVMELLMQNKGILIPAEQFMEKIWGYNTEVENSVVWVYISYLRKKIQNLGAPVVIRAVRGLGYKLEEG